MSGPRLFSILCQRSCHSVEKKTLVLSPTTHTTTLFDLSGHYILSREWGVIADHVQSNYHGAIISQVLLRGIVIMIGCVLSQLKPRALSYT